MKVVAVTIMLLSIQFMPSFAQGPISSPYLPPAPTPLGPSQDGMCWLRFGNCINSHVNNTQSNPQFDPSSPSFNLTDFLCCPLVQQAATSERPCFCTVKTYLQQNPSYVANVTQLLSVCRVVNSLASLNRFCQGEVSSPIPAPMMPTPMIPPPGNT